MTMENNVDQFVSMKNLTPKGLANVVTHMSGRGMGADFSNGASLRDWARYYAVSNSMKISPVLFRANLKIKTEREDKKEKA